MKRILSMLFLLFLLFLLLSGCSSVTKSDYEALQLEHELLEEEYSDLLLYVEDLEHEIDTYQSLRWDLEDIGTTYLACAKQSEIPPILMIILLKAHTVTL